MVDHGSRSAYRTIVGLSDTERAELMGLCLRHAGRFELHDQPRYIDITPLWLGDLIISYFEADADEGDLSLGRFLELAIAGAPVEPPQ